MWIYLAIIIRSALISASFSSPVGMPDDCTVITAHVVGREAGDVMDKDHQ